MQGYCKAVLLPGIAERRLGVSLYTQPAELALGAPSSNQETMQQS